MYFDDYSTSFQSLYSPMYNLQTSYSAIGGGAYGAGAGYGAGMGMSAGMYPGMGVYNGSMTNIAVGQFGADQLIKNDDKLNNYYARPIATHKKKDELPTILGIIGTALGTAALLLAMRKGKKAKTPAPAPAPAPAPTPGPIPTPGPSSVTPNVPSVVIKPVGGTPVPVPTPGPIPTPGPTPGPIPTPGPSSVTPNVPSVVIKPVSGVPAPVKPNLQSVAVDTPFEEVVSQRLLNAPSQTLGLPHITGAQNGTLPVLRQGNKVDLKPISEYLPKDNMFSTLPASAAVSADDVVTTIKGYLPAPGETAKIKAGMEKLQQRAVLPSSGEVYGATQQSILNKANDNFIMHHPEFAGKGQMVYAENAGNSIADTAKGADKLAALLRQLQA